MADGVAEDLELREQVRQLRDDQNRLRQEQDRLKQQADSNGQGKGQGQGEDSQPDQQKGQAEGAGQPDAKEDKKPDDKKDEPKKKPGSWVREHPIALVVILILLIVGAIGVFLLLQYLGSYVSTDDAQVDAHINAVTSRVAGTVVGVYAEDNSSVKAGQTLVDIDPRDFKVSVEQAQAQLSQAQAGIQAQNPNVPITQTAQATNVTSSTEDVTNALAGLAAARQSYEAAVAQLRQAEANYANAASDEARYKQLVDKEEVSKEQYDAKLTAKLAQKAVVDAQQASADAAKDTIAQRQSALAQARTRELETRTNAPRQVEIQKAQVASRHADTKRYRAELDQALLNLSYAKISAPVSGVVGRRSVEVGQQVSPGQQLMGITNLDDIWVTANFKETELRNLKPGQPVKIHVDSFNANFDGYVDSMPGASGAKYSLLPPENATGNYVKVVQRLPVRIRFKSEQSGLERLRPGMSVTPKVSIR
jgi:membrane fusion protein (multidrug efflux system)